MTESKQCARCAQPFEIPASEYPEFNIGRLRKYCFPCADIIAREETEASFQKEEGAREAKWRKICPPLYSETDPKDARIHPKFREAVESWDPSGRIGIGLIGPSGTGKTRILFSALRRAFDAGKSVQFVSHNQFSKMVIDAFSGAYAEAARKALEDLFRADVLFVDDLGKAPSTERCDAELEELFERRATHLRPTLWTSNGSGKWLESRFGPDRGEPLVRRLAEFSQVIKA